MEPIDPASLAGLPVAIGRDRFQTFTVATKGNQSKAVRLYSWNVEASASLWGGFHVLEVVLRNALHTELEIMFNRSDWWEKAHLNEEDRRAVSSALVFLRRTKGDMWTPGHIVAELSFGFWIGLLANRYHAQLWATALHMAFPYYSGRRGDVHTTLERLRKLRNRVAHHEPIFARDLSYDHSALLGYLSPDANTWVQSHSRLPGILLGRSETIAGTRQTRF